ncbi:hypothetical protein AOLI_G00114720 [Acnodon oligacanthus]
MGRALDLLINGTPACVMLPGYATLDPLLTPAASAEFPYTLPLAVYLWSYTTAAEAERAHNLYTDWSTGGEAPQIMDSDRVPGFDAALCLWFPRSSIMQGENDGERRIPKEVSLARILSTTAQPAQKRGREKGPYVAFRSS